MNKRIKELLYKDGLYDRIADPYDKHRNGDYNGSLEDDLVRFAQLIIQQCADICQNFKVYYAEDTYGTKSQIAEETAKDLADMLKEHWET